MKTINKAKRAKIKIRKDRTANGTFAKGNTLGKGRAKGSKNKTVVVRSAGKPLDNTRKKGAALGLPKGGRPPGSKNKSTLLMAQLRQAGPNLLKRLIGIANSGDVPALRTVLAPLIAAASDNPVRWKFGALKTMDDLRMESERILRGIEEGVLTPEQGIKIRTLLSGHSDDIKASQLTNRRAEFEKEQKQFKAVREDPYCWALAMELMWRMHELDVPEDSYQHPYLAQVVDIAAADAPATLNHNEVVKKWKRSVHYNLSLDRGGPLSSGDLVEIKRCGNDQHEDLDRPASGRETLH